METKILILIAFFLCTLGLKSQDTHWRGEQRNGHYQATHLLSQWPDEGPEQILSVEGIGRGFSSVIVSNGTMYTTGMIDTMDYLTAINFTGRIKWQIPYGRSWIRSYPDTRSTPTLENDRLYLVSGTGQLVCVDAENGKIIWSKSVDSDFEGEWSRWGVAESPLIVDDMVICSPGGKQTSVVALNKFSGDLIWKTESLGAARSYVSPVLYESEEQRFILAMTAEQLLAIDPGSGEINWYYQYFKPEWTDRSSIIITNSPIYKGNEIFISKGYNYPSVMLEMDPFGAGVKEKWVNRTLDTHHGGFVEVEGHIYGSNWLSNRQGKWVCLDWDSGEVKYEEEWYNKGSIIYADGMLYCYEEKSGHVALIKPDPLRFSVVSSFKVEQGNGPHWAHPTIFDGKLFIRHGDVLMVYNIAQSG